MNLSLPFSSMAALLQKLNGYKVYTICGTSLVYIWCSYLLGLFVSAGDLAASSFQPVQTLDLHGAVMATLGILGAAGFRHAIQKVEDIIAVLTNVTTASSTQP